MLFVVIFLGHHHATARAKADIRSRKCSDGLCEVFFHLRYGIPWFRFSTGKESGDPGNKLGARFGGAVEPFNDGLSMSGDLLSEDNLIGFASMYLHHKPRVEVHLCTPKRVLVLVVKRWLSFSRASLGSSR